MTSKDEFIYKAKLAEDTERFEDMVRYIKSVVELGSELSIEERNLLSVDYKNSIGGRRTAWKVLSSFEKKEERMTLSQPNSQRNLALIRSYKKKIEEELNQYCNEILNLLDSHLVKSATNPEAKVFFHKMKGDYYRYIAEYASGDQLKKATNEALEAYNAASAIANWELKKSNPIRLGLALNFSVFYYEVLNDTAKACQLANSAFDGDFVEYDEIDEDQYKDSITIMQLIRDNLTLWTSELEDEGRNIENQ